MPKSKAGWSLRQGHPHEKIALTPKAEAPADSWFADASLSWEQFTERAKVEAGRMNRSRIAAYVNASARMET